MIKFLINLFKRQQPQPQPQSQLYIVACEGRKAYLDRQRQRQCENYDAVLKALQDKLSYCGSAYYSVLSEGYTYEHLSDQHWDQLFEHFQSLGFNVQAERRFCRYITIDL